MERIRLPVPLCSVCSFTHRGVSVRAKNVPKTWDSLRSPTEHRPVHVVFPSPVRWVPEVHPSSGDRAPEKRSPGTAFCPGWETQFTGGQASEPPTGKNRPYCPWRSRLPECVTPEGTKFPIDQSPLTKLLPDPKETQVQDCNSTHCKDNLFA